MTRHQKFCMLVQTFVQTRAICAFLDHNPDEMPTSYLALKGALEISEDCIPTDFGTAAIEYFAYRTSGKPMPNWLED
jgi:hypothetical protein